MQLDSYWHKFVAQMGNAEGEQQGDVVLWLTGPVAGERSVQVPSASVSLAAEAGVLIGFEVTMPDGTRAFYPAGSVLAIVDAPLPENRKA